MLIKMPKERVKLCSKARMYEREFGKEFQVNPSNELFCILCNTTVNCEKRFRVTKHRQSAKHQRSLLPSTTTTTKQLFLPQPKKEFKAKLVETFLTADIPLKKLQNSRVRELFTDLGQAVPSESACRTHVATLAEQEMDRIKKKLAGKDIFMVLDESEVLNNKYINVLVGDAAEPEKTCHRLQRCGDCQPAQCRSKDR